MRDIFLTNTLTGKKEKVETITPGQMKMYSCGPTVYNFIHIGNLRAALVADLIYRYFVHAGYDVKYVRNYTDIDDRIINQSIEQKIPFTEITEKFIQEVEKDYALAGLKEPTYKTKATEHIPHMIGIIENLIKNGHAYESQGEVFYSVESFKGYGKLSKKSLEDLESGIRVEVNSHKKNPLDFSLWKPVKPGEPSWESPWGKGRPGWHIECSAMASRWLGDQIDIHHGAVDLIFPHHENEIAQSEGASHQDPFVKYWVHNAFLTLDKEKMSKSLGNVFSAREFLKEFSGEVARTLLLSVHYRSQLDFGEDSIDHALSALERIYEAKKTALEYSQKRLAMPDQRAESMWGEFISDCELAKNNIEKAFANDLNTPEAFSALFVLIREFNRVLKEPKTAGTPSVAMAAQVFLQVLDQHFVPVLGIGASRPEKIFEELSRIRASRIKQAGATVMSAQDIEKKLDERIAARKNKDFQLADQIRDDLLKAGVEIKDSPSGTTWKYK